MTIVPLQPKTASIHVLRRNPILQAALLSLFAAPLLPAAAQTPAAINAGTAAQEPSKLPVFPEIVVSADQQFERRAGSKTVIRSEDLERQGATDMGNMIRYQPLISAPMSASGGGNVWDGAGNTGYNIRGLEGNRVSLDVDGISLPDAAPKPDASTLNAFGAGRDYFDPETFREVRIESGGTSITGASPGLGGGVTFITKSPEDYLNAGKDSYIGYKYGRTTANRSNAHTLTGAAKLGAMQALAVYVRRDGEQTDSRGSVQENPDDWHSDALLTKLVWGAGTGQKLDLTLDMYERKNKRSVDNKVGTSYPDGVMQDSTTRRSRISLGHEIVLKDFALFDRLNSKLYLQDAKTQDKTDAAYITGGRLYQRAIDTAFVNDSTGLTSEAFKQVNAANALVYGVQLEHTKSRRPWREDRTVVATGQHQITSKNRMADLDGTRVALYLRDDLTFDLAGHKAVLTPGLRGDYRKLEPKNLQNYVVAVPNAAKEVRKESDSYFTPSLALSVDLSDRMNAYATLTRGTRLPSAAERTGTYDSFSYTGTGVGYAVLGNADLRKETSTAFELGLKGQLAKGLLMNASVYRTDYKDMIEYAAQAPDPVNFPTITFGLFRPENIGDARTWGGELSLRAELGSWSPALAGYHIDAATGVAHGRSTNRATGERAGLASVAPAKTAVTFGYDHASELFGVALTALHAGDKQAPNDVLTGATTALYRVPSYTILDLTSYWNVHKNARIIVGVYNLTDRKYWDYAASRSLPAGTNAVTRADIERYAKPGRNVAASLNVSF